MNNIKRIKLKDGNRFQQQQGDVIIELAEIPPGAQPCNKSGVIAEGEGHHEHAFIDPAIVQMFEFDDRTYFEVQADTKLVHRTKGSHSQGEYSFMDYERGRRQIQPKKQRE